MLYKMRKVTYHAIARLLMIFFGFLVHCVIIYVCMVPILLMLPNAAGGGDDESFNLAAGLVVTWLCFNFSGSLFVVFIKKYGTILYIVNMVLLNVVLYLIFIFFHIAKKI